MAFILCVRTAEPVIDLVTSYISQAPCRYIAGSCPRQDVGPCFQGKTSWWVRVLGFGYGPMAQVDEGHSQRQVGPLLRVVSLWALWTQKQRDLVLANTSPHEQQQTNQTWGWCCFRLLVMPLVLRGPRHNGFRKTVPCAMCCVYFYPNVGSSAYLYFVHY